MVCSPPINGVSTQKSPLTETFQNLIRGAWQGPLSVIHPREFKDTLGISYSQFKDTRQVLLALITCLYSFYISLTFIEHFSTTVKNSWR
jgi:hypothetical protein